MPKPVYFITYVDRSVTEADRAAVEKVLGAGQVAWLPYNGLIAVGTPPRVEMFEPQYAAGKARTKTAK